jgi:hypothetical protein
MDVITLGIEALITVVAMLCLLTLLCLLFAETVRLFIDGFKGE